MAETWVVLVEAAGAGGTIGRDDVASLLEVLASGPYAGALHSPDRYALQMPAAGATAAEALYGALSRWSEAVRQLGLAEWEVVRTEVFTPEELERDLENHHRQAMPIPGSAPISTFDGDDEIGHELVRRAFSDALTGLLSRSVFEHRLHAALGRTDSQRGTTVVRVDIDAFGRINDRFGSTVGDEVVVVVARRLAAVVRRGESLARLGGDSYALVLPDTEVEAALAVVRRLLDEVRRPLTVDGEEVTVTASAGVAGGRPGENAQVVLDNADAALAEAKQQGGDRHVVFQTALPQPARDRPVKPTFALHPDRLAMLLLVQEATIAANEADTLQQAAGVVMRQLGAHMGFAVGHVWAFPAEGSTAPSGSWWHVADGGDYRAFQEASDRLLRLPGVDLPQQVSATGRPIWVTDLAAEEACLRREAALASGLASAIAFPVLVGREVVAVVEFFARVRLEVAGSFSDVVATIGTQLGRVVERERAAASVRRAAEQVRLSEARLQEAQVLARLGSWHYDLRTGEAAWSHEMYHLLGLMPGERTPDLDAARSSVDPADRARARAALSRLVSSGDRMTQDIRIVQANGEVRWHHVEGSAIKDEKGLVVAIHGTSQDITERKLVEEALREREGQLTEVHRIARLGSWELDLASGRLTWTGEMCRLWGWEPGGPVSLEAFIATVHPDDRRSVRDAFHDRRWLPPASLDFRAVVEGAEQRWFRVRARVRCGENGAPIKLHGTMQDITEEKRAEERLRASMQRYERILQTAREGILTVDANGITTFANPRMAEIAGYSIDEMLGVPVSTLVADATGVAAAERRRRRRAGISEHYETELRAKGGNVVHVLVSASPLVDESGAYCGSLAMVTDISPLREAEEQLRLHAPRS